MVRFREREEEGAERRGGEGQLRETVKTEIRMEKKERKRVEQQTRPVAGQRAGKGEERGWDGWGAVNAR